MVGHIISVEYALAASFGSPTSAEPIHLVLDLWKVAEKEDRCQEGGNHRMGLVIGRGGLSPRLIGSTDMRRQLTLAYEIVRAS